MVILKFPIKLVSYYLSKIIIIYHELDALKNVYGKEKQKIFSIDKHSSDYSMTYNRSIPSDVNTLNNINLNSNFSN